jgi:ABC-2 type transport system permease protein
MTDDAPPQPPGTAEATPQGRAGLLEVAGQELHDLCLGRGPVLLLGYSVLLSVVTYLTATNKALNYLEQREAVSFTLQLAVGVGVLLTLVLGADAISGERERGTLETLLLTPVPRRTLVLGKLLGTAGLWVACMVVTVPYVVVLSRGVSVLGAALLLELTVGTALAVGLAAVGIVFSGLAASNRGSLSGSLLLLFALFAPTQLPSGAQKGWFGDLLNHLNPIASGERYLGKVIVDGHPWTNDLGLLVSPLVTAVVAFAVLVLAGERLMRLDVAVSGG